MSKQQHKPQEKRATHWALSIIITIMTYKKVFFRQLGKITVHIWEREVGDLAQGNEDLLLGEELCPLNPLGLTPD